MQQSKAIPDDIFKGVEETSLAAFNTADIFNILLCQNSPIMELDLLKMLTGEKRLPSEREDIFRLHFLLYNALYALKYEAGGRGFYLHLDPMRIRLLKTQDAGLCHYYFTEAGKHCDVPAAGHLFCAGHRGFSAEAGVSFDPMLDFYSNEENISFGQSDILEKLMNGVIIYAMRRGVIESAMKFLGLSRPDMKSIKKRYHEMAMLYHPDKNKGDDTLMKELNHSYQILLEVFVL